MHVTRITISKYLSIIRLYMQEHRELRSIPSTQKSNPSDIGFVKHNSFRFWCALDTQQNILHISHICLVYISNRFTPHATNECHIKKSTRKVQICLELMIRLYVMLTYATRVLYFNNENPSLFLRSSWIYVSIFGRLSIISVIGKSPTKL